MFQVVLSTRAKKDLKKLNSTSYYERVKRALMDFKDNPLIGDVKALKNFPFAKYRKRIGNYRVLFNIDVDEKRVYIYRIVHRKEAYKT